MATTYGWVTDTEADAYFLTRVQATDWFLSTTPKPALLTTAHKQIIRSKSLSLPEDTTAIPEALRLEAQCEQALFLLVHGADIDIRMGLQSQNVVEAGELKEKYELDRFDGVPLSHTVLDILEDYVDSSFLGYSELSRDEDT